MWRKRLVYKYSELVGASKKSFADAVRLAVEEAGKTVRGIEWAEVTGLKVKVTRNKIAEYQAIVKIGFKVER